MPVWIGAAVIWLFAPITGFAAVWLFALLGLIAMRAPGANEGGLPTIISACLTGSWLANFWWLRRRVASPRYLRITAVLLAVGGAGGLASIVWVLRSPASSGLSPG